MSRFSCVITGFASEPSTLTYGIERLVLRTPGFLRSNNGNVGLRDRRTHRETLPGQRRGRHFNRRRAALNYARRNKVHQYKSYPRWDSRVFGLTGVVDVVKTTYFGKKKQKN